MKQLLLIVFSILILSPLASQKPVNKKDLTVVSSPTYISTMSGNVITDEYGHATIYLPDDFEELNTNFKYQLTVIKSFAQVTISKEVKDNEFSIMTQLPNVKVSWQLTSTQKAPKVIAIGRKL